MIVGEVVKWHESYADGFMLKDVGYGIIIDILNYDRKSFGPGIVREPYKVYKVYRNKYNDVMFPSHDRIGTISNSFSSDSCRAIITAPRA